MAENSDVMHALALWALVHESADDAWKAAVARGLASQPGAEAGSTDAFVDALAAAINAEKERLKESISAEQAGMGGGTAASGAATTADAALEELRFEVGELRGRIESMQATLDAISAALDARRT